MLLASHGSPTLLEPNIVSPNYSANTAYVSVSTHFTKSANTFNLLCPKLQTEGIYLIIAIVANAMLGKLDGLLIAG